MDGQTKRKEPSPRKMKATKTSQKLIDTKQPTCLTAQHHCHNKKKDKENT